MRIVDLYYVIIKFQGIGNRTLILHCINWKERRRQNFDSVIIIRLSLLVHNLNLVVSLTFYYMILILQPYSSVPTDSHSPQFAVDMLEIMPLLSALSHT